MRAVLDFPDGFGSDPTLMLGPASVSADRPAAPGFESGKGAATAGIAGSAYEPGPFRASYPSGLKPDGHPSQLGAAFDSGGFRPRTVAELESNEGMCREPQSLVVTTMIVGLLLAAMGFFLGFQ